MAEERRKARWIGWRYLALGAVGGTAAAGLAWATISGVDVPPGWATLIGAIIGLSAIAWQTRAGFTNLIKSQEHSAIVDRGARNERARLDREAREHQAELDRVARQAAKDSERRELAAALQGELGSINSRFNNIVHSLHLQEMIYREMARTRTPITSDFRITKIPTPVYEANIPRIGLLGASVVADVAEVYGAMSFGLEWPKEHIEPQMMADVLKSIQQGLSEVNDDAIHLSKRLMAIQVGSEDPGALLFARQRRKKGAGAANADQGPGQR